MSSATQASPLPEQSEAPAPGPRSLLRASCRRAHPPSCSACGQAGRALPRLCFLSCSQYTLPQICLASFFLPCSLAWWSGLSPSSLILAWGSGRDCSATCVNVWCVSRAACVCCVCASAPGTDVCRRGSEVPPLPGNQNPVGSTLFCFLLPAEFGPEGCRARRKPTTSYSPGWFEFF